MKMDDIRVIMVAKLLLVIEVLSELSSYQKYYKYMLPWLSIATACQTQERNSCMDAFILANS